MGLLFRVHDGGQRSSEGEIAIGMAEAEP